MEHHPILQFCIEKGVLVDKDALELLQEIEDLDTTKLFLECIIQHSSQRILTKNFFHNSLLLEQVFSHLPHERQKYIEKFRVKLGLRIEISREIQPLPQPSLPINTHTPQFHYLSSPFKILSPPSLLGKKIEVQDFTKHFRNRFLDMKLILQEHRELTNLISLNKLSQARQGVSVIGMVLDKRVTQNKNIIIEIEDLTGSAKALISVNKPELLEKAEDIVVDSIIGLKCSGGKEILFVNDIIFPDAHLFQRKHSTTEDYAAFIGDLHVGVDKFMESNFLKFINYLNGAVSNTSSAPRIKYLFVIGDLVCGVGIYPGQDKELVLKDLEQQFKRVAELFSLIRKDIHILICTGNHDGVRIMEPQPILDEKYAWPLYELENVTFVTNPAYVNFGGTDDFLGFNILLYHGYSFHYFVDHVDHLRKSKATNNPEKIMAFLLKHRHLAPSHSATLYFPHDKDALLIREVPDILFSGHTHKSALSYYNNVLLISCSTWESKTEFQEKMGNEPDFCKVPLLNLKTRAIQVLDFE